MPQPTSFPDGVNRRLFLSPRRPLRTESPG